MPRLHLDVIIPHAHAALTVLLGASGILQAVLASASLHAVLAPRGVGNCSCLRQWNLQRQIQMCVAGEFAREDKAHVSVW
jgi:hypothetical protein